MIFLYWHLSQCTCRLLSLLNLPISILSMINASLAFMASNDLFGGYVSWASLLLPISPTSTIMAPTSEKHPSMSFLKHIYSWQIYYRPPNTTKGPGSEIHWKSDSLGLIDHIFEYLALIKTLRYVLCDFACCWCLSSLVYSRTGPQKDDFQILPLIDSLADSMLLSPLYLLL